MSGEREGIKCLDISIGLICCSECDGILIHPIKLSCGHHVCERCLVDLFGNQAEIICKIENCGENNETHTSEHCKFAKKESPDGDEIPPMQLSTNAPEYDAIQRGLQDGQPKDSAPDDVTSIREDYERMKEDREKILEKLKDVDKHNKEVADHLDDAHAALLRVANQSQKVTSLEARLDELSRQRLQIADVNGEWIWKITNCSQKREQTGGINSPPFYSSCFGYKICGRIYLNGDGLGHGTHLSFFFVIMKGEFDNLLPWPFQQRVTLTIMDQDKRTENLSDTFQPDPNSSSFRKPVTEMNLAFGCPRFIEHRCLETPTYLQDDTIFLKIKIDLSNLSDAASFQGHANEVEGEEEDDQ